MKHLIFFDGECRLCHRSVEHIIAMDKRSIFSFAPLEGKTAQQYFSGAKKKYKTKNSLVLIEDYPSDKIWIQARGVARIYWLLGGKRKILGIFCFFPAFFIDPFYRFVATHRHKIGQREKLSSLTKENKEYFLP